MLTTREAAQRLGLKTSGAVRQLILNGRLQAIKHGRDWLIDDEEIERFQQVQRKVGRPKKNERGNERGSSTIETDDTAS